MKKNSPPDERPFDEIMKERARALVLERAAKPSRARKILGTAYSVLIVVGIALFFALCLVTYFLGGFEGTVFDTP